MKPSAPDIILSIEHKLRKDLCEKHPFIEDMEHPATLTVESMGTKPVRLIFQLAETFDKGLRKEMIAIIRGKAAQYDLRASGPKE